MLVRLKKRLPSHSGSPFAGLTNNQLRTKISFSYDGGMRSRKEL